MKQKKILDLGRLLAGPIARKKMDEGKLKADIIMRRAHIDMSAINKEERRVAITISTEQPVRRFDYWSDQHYDEVLLHSAENIDLSRANTAKLRYMHGEGRYGELPIGFLENVRIENKQLKADAVFSKANPDADMLWRMVEEGTLTEISVGGSKKKVRVTEREGDVSLVEVTLWEFEEASLVDIGADKNAGIGRKKQNEEGEFMKKLEELKRQLAALKKGDDKEAIKRKQSEIDVEMKSLADENKELKRKAAIATLVASHPGMLSDEEVKRHMDDKKLTTEDLARAMLDVKKENQAQVGFKQSGGEYEVKRAVADALVMRAGFTVKEPHADVARYAGASLQDIVRAVTGYDGYDRDEMVKRAMSTDDFPVLLGNVANRTLVSAYEEANPTFQLWTAVKETPDFKEMTEVSFVQAGGRMRKVREGGEKKNLEFGEVAEKWRIESYGEEIRLTREMIINDDLGAFTDAIKAFGVMAARTANGIVYDLLQGKGDFSNYKMADGKAIFVAGHNNLDATGAVLSTGAITSGRTKMRRQKGEGGQALNIVPSNILVSPENETLAKQLVSSEADPSSSNAGVMNPHKNAFQVIVDAELDALPWYMTASMRTVKVGYLAGTNRQPIVREKDRTLSGVTFECVFDFGVVVEDFRGLYKNAGA